MSEKIKVTLDGTAETMLQSFYARAKYSLKKGHKFYDAKAIEIVKQLDYDFSRAEKDAAMSSGNRRSDGRSACCDRRSGHVLNRGGCKENAIHYL